MERVKVQAGVREDAGKGYARRLRRDGFVPAVIYAKKLNRLLKVPPATIKTLRAINFSESTILDLEIANEKKKESLSAIIKYVQYHPLTEDIIHIDFMKVSLEEKIRVHVPLVFKGEAKGIKEGGVFERVYREIEIEALPLDIPEKIEVDVSSLDIGDSLHVSDLAIPKSLKLITGFEDTIATVVAKKEEEEVAPEEAPLEEPEVIKEKKKEEGGEERGEGRKEEGKKEEGSKEKGKKEKE